MLGKWAVLDIETTGLDPNYDEIIDVGFLQFEGTKLVKRYSTLVRARIPVPYYIQKLTKISHEIIKDAPVLESILPEILELYGHRILCHNCSFEESFLKPHFAKIKDEKPSEIFEDSLFFLALMFPQKSSLSLEKFITNWGIKCAESHRGFEDALDLLKVLLVGVELVSQDPEKLHILISLFEKYHFQNYWPLNFLTMKSEDRREIAFQIDFDLDGHVIIAEEREKSGNPSFTSSPKWIKTEFTGDNIKSIFREESRIRQILPNYKYRKPQEDLAVRLGQAFKNKVHSIIEAPTGTGKTLGYLLPSAVFALSENQQVLIATGTKILQNQILTKDSIDLYRTFGFEPNELKIKKLVGSNNHFCELLFREERSEKFQSQDQKISEIFFEMVFYYNSNRSEPLTREEIPFVLKKKLPHMEAREKQIAVDFRSCSGQKCPFKNGCSYIEGLRQAKAANIIIGNHSLLYNWTKSFPLPDHIVVDEAHRLERETTAAFTLEFGQRAMENFQQNLKSLNGLGSLFYLIIKGSSTQEESEQIIADVKRKILSISENMEMVLTPLPELFEDYFKRLPKYTSLYWNEASFFRLEEKNDPLVVSLSKKILILHELLQDLSKILTFYSEDYNGKDENDIVAITKFNNFVGVLNDLFLPLDLAVKPKEGYVSTLKYHEEYGYALCSSPINVGKLVYENLLSNAKSVVFTSATLGGFSESAGIRGVEWALGYPYLSPEKRFKQGLYLGPVYNYEKNAKIFLCDDVPSLGDPNFLPKVLYLIFNLVRNLQGRSLLLFSSKDRFELAREMLLKEFEGEIPLFIQGMGGSVVEEFKKSNNGILLGLETFGEGIDIPGNDLVFVFIDKIPDIRMDLVINERRQFYERTFGNEFVDYYLASRAISLHQKLGRLLRNENDRGGAIIVDSRVKIWKGKTLEKFFKLMKPYSIKKASLNVALQELEDFILPQLKEC